MTKRAIAAFFLGLPSLAQAQPLANQPFAADGFSVVFPLAGAVQRRDEPVQFHPQLIVHQYEQAAGGARFSVTRIPLRDPPGGAEFSAEEVDGYARHMANRDATCSGYSEVTRFEISTGQGRQFQQWNCLAVAPQRQRLGSLEIPPRENRSVRLVVAGDQGFVISAILPSGADAAPADAFLQSFELISP